MKFLRSALSEIVGLFVDDWLFALLLVLWVIAFSEGGVHLSSRAAAPILFFSPIALLTFVFVVRKARALAETPRTP